MVVLFVCSKGGLDRARKIEGPLTALPGQQEVQCSVRGGVVQQAQGGQGQEDREVPLPALPGPSRTGPDPGANYADLDRLLKCRF